MSELSENARLWLAIMRDANSHSDVQLTLGIMGLFNRVIPISDAEKAEISEIIKADIREKNASYLGYGAINARLSRMSPENPYGE